MAKQIQQRRLVSREEAAEILRCTPQTISNWVNKGVIKKHLIKGRLYLDLATIEQCFDTYEEAAQSNDNIKKLTAELRHKENELTEVIRSVAEDLNLWGELFPADFNRSTLTQIIRITDGMLTERETGMLTDLLQITNDTRIKPSDIARKYGVSGQTLVNDVKKAIRKLMRCPSLTSLRVKNKELSVQNSLLIMQNAELRKSVSKYGVEHLSSIAGVNTSKFEAMRNLLKTRLIEYDISTRALNCLRAAEIDTVGDLVSFEKKDLIRFRNMGKRSLFELENLVNSLHLEFGMNVAPYHLEIKDI